ncbi:hypothetical protein A5735_15730 [Mycolicibacter heraklionensis]|nr:hypothetical protein A5735_15730 [Mycolicibacter heraklionensis]
MFDVGLPELEALGAAGDNLLVAAISGWAQVEAAAAARRLAAIAELVARRTDGPALERSRWACDNWDAAAAEVAAAEHISHGMASSQMYLASALRERLPKVGALLADGVISVRLAATISWHTTLITDPGVLALVDAELAVLATALGPLSAAKTATAIDALIDRHDPAAVRRASTTARGREVVIDSANSESGVTGLWGRLFAVDAAALDQRLDKMARSVCEDDPRTVAQRRADALGALAAGADTLACACGQQACPATHGADARAAQVVVHVVAEAPPEAGAGTKPPNRAATTSGRIVGGGSVPAPLLAELIRGGATVNPLRFCAEAENRYRPSARLAAFVRARDLTCRFPGCDRPATACDIDHAIAHPRGPTHSANLRCLCRKHHLLKTFWIGPGGWTDRQHPDGTIEWTAPTGHTYLTRPGSQLLFPALCRPNPPPPTAAAPDPPPTQRGVMMPIRKRTRQQDRVRCINAERALNADYAAQVIAERNQPPPF